MIADMTAQEPPALQQRIVLIHQHRLPDKEYLPVLEGRELVEFDPGLLVTLPKRLEIGLVPIPTRQATQ